MTDIFVASIEDAYLLSEKLPELKLSDFNIEHLSEKNENTIRKDTCTHQCSKKYL